MKMEYQAFKGDEQHIVFTDHAIFQFIKEQMSCKHVVP